MADLIAFISGPDPRGMTPVYYLGRDGALHPINTAAVATKWFGANWISQIRWCGDSQGQVLPQYAADFARPRGVPITELTTQLP
jgi:hypothetical protein